MISRVALALVLHELAERARDRWVIVATVLFALLTVGVTLYGRAAGEAAGAVTAPSLVSLAAFLVPLVALVLGHDAIVGERERNTLGLLLAMPVRRYEVLLAKYLGRLLALSVAVVGGLLASALLLDTGPRQTVLYLVPHTLLLGASFLSLGMLISVSTWRHTTAATLAVVAWFGLVLFWDLGLLALLVATDGAISQQSILALVVCNPAGLYRTGLLVDLVGAEPLRELGLVVALPGQMLQGAIWTAWTVGPLLAGIVLLARPNAVKG